MKIDKSKLLDTQGRPLTQSLFLEINYNQDYAIYTLDGEDKTYQGKVYPSLKRLYLESNDPTEYVFARKYLLDWAHWKRLNGSQVLKPHFDKWRDELEIAIRSEAVQAIIDFSADEKGFQAAKWLADGGWIKKGPGRPKKEDRERDEKINAGIREGVESDILRMADFREK